MEVITFYDCCAQSMDIHAIHMLISNKGCCSWGKHPWLGGNVKLLSSSPSKLDRIMKPRIFGPTHSHEMLSL